MDGIANQSRASLDSLSHNELCEIFKYLPVKERTRMRQVNNKYRAFVDYQYGTLKKVREFVHPLIPSISFSSFIFYQTLIQTALISSSFGNGFSFRVSSILSSNISMIAPFGFAYWLPTSIAFAIFGMKNDSSYQKAAHFAPLLGITIFTPVAYTCYALSASSSITRGIINGIHSQAMMLFAYAPMTAGFLGMHSVRQSIQGAVIGDPFARYPRVRRHEFESITDKSDKAAAIAFFMTNIAATLIWRNPIIADTISYSLTAIAKVAAMRILADATEKRNERNYVTRLNQK